MKAIMISGKPKWSALIMNGDKTKEIRKNKALASAIRKLIDEYGFADIYWYCSKNESLHYVSFKGWCNGNTWKKERPLASCSEDYSGKVVFKFRCYKVEEISWQIGVYQLEQQGFSDFLNECCLGFCELKNYLNKKNGYAIHISDLEIFDKPKELSEFYKVGYNEALVNSLKGKPFPISPHFIQNQYLLRKAPQNFCYVEESL